MRLWLGFLFVAVFLSASASVLLRTNQAPIPLPPREDVIVSVAAAPEPANQVMPTEEFRTFAAEVMGSLPSVENFRKGVDLPILLAADHFVRLNEAVGEDGALQEEAMRVYRECANSGQYQDSVRALCFWNLRAIGKKTGKQVGRNSAPPHIRELTDRL